MKNVELLAPAGDFECLETALHFGADAVYIGGDLLQLRAKKAGFNREDLQKAVNLAHQKGKKLYVTVNAFANNEEIDACSDYAHFLEDVGVDAAIISDPGVFVAFGEAAPNLERHLSTQANCTNFKTAELFASLGAKRIVLAREMSLEEIRQLRRRLDPSVELEAFIHGAMCMAYSGRCMISSYLIGRSGNRGECAQPCRWQYHVVEEKRPGEYMPVCEDENGTYIFSAKDLCLMPVLPQLIEAGVASLKIEGRMKTEYYVATVTAAYRRALDLYAESPEAFEAELPALMAELACASHRDSDTGFALDKPQNPGGAEGFHQDREYIARAIADSRAGENARFLLKNRFHAGDVLELLTPSGVKAVKAVPFLREKTGEMVDTLGVGGEIIAMPVEHDVRTGDILRGEVRNHRR